ncbi:fructose-6-phosphate aldolase [Loigolactobacillus coryniformis]|uniref:fructose-6-phosphate aldolase n=1 Tax=Loigolactobacillus coryniformis TaxID=1610 RepID=UPI002340C8A9|nr:fructose-6-phosphate aldolase [Loigolactobacillus coryniformis]MDC4185331.1 fructose-6-phosphate aldolase [Loigolactobacillus coryniformis]
MEFLLDTIHLADIERYTKCLPIAGVTSNPTIVKKEGKIDFFPHMQEIRQLIGPKATLHVQVVGQTPAAMLADAHAILKNIDASVYIKVPTTELGLQVIKQLKAEGHHVTATAIYTKFQGYLAIAAGADYIAPYYNRMENMNLDAAATVAEFAKLIQQNNANTKILAASFHNVGQVNTAFENGAQAATMGVDIIQAALQMPAIDQAVKAFTNDWESIYGAQQTIHDL